MISELNLADESTTRLFLIVVVPPLPAIVISAALVAKSSLDVAELPEKNSTVPAVEVNLTVSSSPLSVPNWKSPLVLNDLVPISVNDNDSLLL